VLVAQGERRIEVLEWLEEDPHPAARVRELPELDWSDDLMPLREQAEGAVRRTLRLASEFADQLWSPDVEVAVDPIAAAWQLAAIAPLGELDQMALLRSESMEALLTALIELMAVAEESFRTSFPEE
jgi:Lon protease-like protein